MVAKKPASKTTSKGSGTYTSYKPNIPSDLKCLILHESPGESKTVNMFLPKGYMAMATIGHFLQTSSKELDLDIDTWKLNLKPDPNKRDVIANIQSAIDVVRANHGLVVLAGDPDREGRVINNSIIEHFKLKPGEYVVHGNPTSLVEKEYMKGVNTPIQHDMNMVESGLGRQALDKYVGWLLTELLWNTSSNYKPYLDGVKTMIDQKITNFETKNQAILKTNKVLQKAVETFRGLDFSKLEDFEERKGTSFGRVQTASLILLIMKELEKFEKEFEVKVNIQALDTKKLTWEYSRNEELESQGPVLLQIYTKLSTGLKNKTIKSIVLSDIKSQVKNLSPLDTLDTLRAQTALGNVLGYNLEQIMGTLQSLYEGGLTTYMRTDTNATSPERGNKEPSAYEEYIQKMITESTNGKYVYREYFEEEAQAGHVGILPTRDFDLNNLISVKKGDGRTLSEDEMIIFEYIVRRTVAAFMEDAQIEYFNYIFDVTCSDDSVEKFIIKDASIVKEGFLEIYHYGRDKYEPKVTYKKGETVDVKEFIIREKEIKLPGSYTETGFVAELKKNGIGRPSTWASIVETLKDKNYIKVVDKKLVVTPKGYWVGQIVTQDEKRFGRFKDISFTSQMETDLDTIAKGKVTKKEVLDNIRKEVESITGDSSRPKAVITGGDVLCQCPSCKKGEISKKQVNGKNVWGCSNYKEGCKFTIWGTVAGHVITDEEADYMIKNQESELITDFISKAGKPFSAKLVFKKGAGFEFVFGN